MADSRQTLTSLIDKSDLPRQTKLSLHARVRRWKTDRQVPEYIFRLRNLIQEKPKVKNYKQFRKYHPTEVYVELKIFKELGSDNKRNVFAFSHKYPDGIWVEENGDLFGYTGYGNLRNIIVPKWFMDKVQTTTKPIYKKGGYRHSEDHHQGTGTFVAGVQAFQGDSFLEELQKVCRQSDDLASIELALTRSGDQSDCVIQLVSVTPMPNQNQRALPMYHRPLRAWGVVEPRLTHPFLPNLVTPMAPKYAMQGACLANAVLNTFKVLDPKPRASKRGRPRAPDLTYEYLFSLVRPGEPYQGAFPALTLQELDTILDAIKRRARAYDFHEREVWRSSNYDDVPNKYEVMCLLIKNDHAYTIHDSYTKGWATRRPDERLRFPSWYEVSYPLTDKPPQKFAGQVHTLDTIANRFDTFAHFDALIEIDDAGLRMRY